jgi:hypothetical protein
VVVLHLGLGTEETENPEQHWHTVAGRLVLSETTTMTVAWYLYIRVLPVACNLYLSVLPVACNLYLSVLPVAVCPTGSLIPVTLSPPCSLVYYL